MMKKTQLLFFAMLFALFVHTGFLYGQSSVYGFSVPKIEGGVQALSVYQGKKILIITLPIEHTAAADTMLYCLDTLATAHISTLAVIATPSYEDGYTAAQKDSLLNWYRSKLGSNIVITDGLYTRKTSGSQQHTLFKWMTTVSLNQVFDLDVDGPGNKFFIRNSGQLYGVIGNIARISGKAVQHAVSQ